MRVDRIWWHEISPEDFYNMEKLPRMGLKGKSNFEITRVPELLEFFGYGANLPADRWTDVTLDARVIGNSNLQAPIQFKCHKRHGTFEVANQNRNDDRNMRHPGWTPDFGWPKNTEVPSSVDDAKRILEVVGGIHIYVVRTQDGVFFTGTTYGRHLPVNWPDALRPLYDGVGSGVIKVGTGSVAQLTPLARKILMAFQDRKSVLVYGPPGTGKPHAVAQVRQMLDKEWSGGESIEFDPNRTERPFTSGFEESPLAPPVLTDWVTFHQDYGYEDFIIGLRPTGEGIRLAPFAGRLLDLAVQLERQGRGSALLVIDEINRGNVPKILGDFMTFMDTNYRSGKPGETNPSAIPVNLPKVQRSTTGDFLTEPIWMLSGDSTMLELPWHFPHELNILATMNSVDRAVAPLDSAIGRRFERIDAYADVEFLAEQLGVSLLAVGEMMESPQVDVESWTPQIASVALLVYLNDQITERLGQDYELGHLYFWNIKTWADLQRIWDHDVWPQLRDRFGARPDQLADLLRVNSHSAPTSYPFRLRTLTGRAINVLPLMGMSELNTAETIDFLVRG
ncbi:MAG: AAA domain-containing protein [Actinomycetales bacterium]|nr:AAA domain-containing protein [Actinomycetales bacterium]